MTPYDNLKHLLDEDYIGGTFVEYGSKQPGVMESRRGVINSVSLGDDRVHIIAGKKVFYDTTRLRKITVEQRADITYIAEPGSWLFAVAKPSVEVPNRVPLLNLTPNDLRN